MSFLGLGGAPTPPPPPPPPPHPPTLAAASVQQAAQAQQAEAAAAAGGGFSDTLKTGSFGAPKPNTTKGAATLGQSGEATP